MTEEEKEQKKQEELEATKKTVEVAARAYISAHTGETGGKVFDMASKTKAGDELLNKAAKNINKKPMIGKVAKKANDSGALDAADKSFKGKNDGGKAKTSDFKPKKDDELEPEKLSNTKVFFKIGTIIKIILIMIPIVFVLFIIAALIAILMDEDDSLNGTVMGGYYSPQCQEITVLFTDKSKNYETIGSATYPLEEYVAGVIKGEIGGFNNIEVYKAFAIAARSYGLSNVNNCTIKSGDIEQVFRELTDSPNDNLIRQAVDETAGQVLLIDNKLYGVQYDAFACIDKDENYYTISQGNQKIPLEWIDSRISKNIKPNWFICNGRENLSEHHGNGLSQWGSLYLASELNYDYKEILSFYLNDYDFTISSSYITSIAGLEVKNTTNAKNILESPIEEFLAANGSSLAQYNDFISQSVNDAGFGTRAGVVAAAVSAINFLYDNFDTKLPYYYGGAAQSGKGIPSYFGTYKPSIPSRSNTVYYYQSFDCSGFISWAIKNGGYNFPRISANSFLERFSNESCDVTDSNCIGQPGDLICSSGHIQLIVATDETSGKYMVAESSGNVIMQETDMHIKHKYGQTRILHLDSFYNNQSNVSNSQ